MALAYPMDTYSQWAFGSNGKWGRRIREALGDDFADELAAEVTGLQDSIVGTACLSGLVTALPKGCFSTFLIPGLIPVHPLPDAMRICKFLESPFLGIAEHHLSHPAQSDETRTEMGRMHEYYSEASIREHLLRAGIPDQPFATRVWDSSFNGNPSQPNTRTQVLWIVEQIMERRLEAVVLVASGWHLLTRAFPTLEKALDEAGMAGYPVLPFPHAIHPHAPVPLARSQDPALDEGIEHTMLEMSRNEWPRVVRYGDVAKAPLLDQHGRAMAKHPLFVDLD